MVRRDKEKNSLFIRKNISPYQCASVAISTSNCRVIALGMPHMFILHCQVAIPSNRCWSWWEEWLKDNNHPSFYEVTVDSVPTCFTSFLNNGVFLWFQLFTWKSELTKKKKSLNTKKENITPMWKMQLLKYRLLKIDLSYLNATFWFHLTMQFFLSFFLVLIPVYILIRLENGKGRWR